MRRRKPWYYKHEPRPGGNVIGAASASSPPAGKRANDGWLEGPGEIMTAMEFRDEEWARMDTTLSDKTARSEFGLTQDEIVSAINAGKLQYRPASMHGNPWLRLLRREVEDTRQDQHGDRYFRERQARTELAGINRELKQLRTRLAALEERRTALLGELGCWWLISLLAPDRAGKTRCWRGCRCGAAASAGQRERSLPSGGTGSFA